MSHFFKLIPEQQDLINVAVPYFKKLSDNRDMGFGNMDLYGVNLNRINSLFFIGPKIKTDLIDVVLGVDEVNFVAFSSDLTIPEDTNLQNVKSYEPLERYVREKIFDQGFYDYDKAVQDGTELISSLGLRCGKYDFYGDVRYFAEEDEAVYIVAVPNNKEMNPCICSVVKNKDIDLFMFNISAYKKDYYNFYLSRQKIEPGTYMFGYFKLASVAVVYFADTGVYLDGIRDHQ